MTRTRNARITHGPKGSVTVSHREYLMDFTPDTDDFYIQTLSINPGLPGIFPWLSSIARNYENYHFKKLVFSFQTQAPTTTPGTFMIAVDYDARDTAPTNKQTMMSYQSSVRTAPWQEVSHVSTPSNLSKYKSYFVRTGPAPSNTDIKTYDTGFAAIASQGVPADLDIGEIYIDYVVTFYTPQYLPTTVYPEIMGGRIDGAGNMTWEMPLGSAAVVDAQAVGLTYDSKAGYVLITSPVDKTYLVIFVANGSSFSSASIGPTVHSTAATIQNTVSSNRVFIAIVLTPSGNPVEFGLVTNSGSTVTGSQIFIACGPVGSF